MITFVHLSDIHFIDRDHATQFDIDQTIRRALIEDLVRKPASGANYDGLLITGDVAFGGKYEEYKRAQEWIDEIAAKTGTSPVNTYVVPGNHDADRSFVKVGLPLWAAHAELRSSDNRNVWHDRIYQQLVADPLQTLLAPLKEYNDFAQRYGCYTGMVKAAVAGEADKPHLAWQRVFEKPLEDGRHIRLHGLNSVLISDEGDAAGKMIVSDYQTSHFEHSPDLIEVVMCHHPPEWLMDKTEIRNALSSFVSIGLFGHEHSTRVEANENFVQLFAGAVQPSRRDSSWLPTYHIIRIGIENNGKQPKLLVQIHTREFDKTTFSFRARRNRGEQPMEEYRLNIPKWDAPAKTDPIPVAIGVRIEVSSQTSSIMTDAETSTPTNSETAQRELMFYFFRLLNPARYAAADEAGLLKEGDDALNPQVMWAEVFHRAASENKLASFWSAVASRTPSLQKNQNPFK
jgi:predicted MPP superfamily phosphohydrolase